MNAADFDAIMAGYQKKQIQAHRQLQKRMDTVYESIPSYKACEDAITTLRVELVRAKIDANAILITEKEKEIDLLIQKRDKLLLAHGFSKEYLSAQYECPDCEDTGFLFDGTKCHCLIRKISQLHLHQSGLSHLLETENFDNLRFDYYEGEDYILFQNSYKHAKKFVEEFANDYRNLFFYGTVGTGKSFLSCCIAREILMQGYEVLYFSSTDLFDQLAKYTFHSNEKEMLATLTKHLKSCDLLLLDDLGTELTNSFVSSELFSILNERNANRKATIISSNFSLEEIRDRYSDRIFSRLASSYDLLQLSGPDIRMLKKLALNKRNQ